MENIKQIEKEKLAKARREKIRVFVITFLIASLVLNYAIIFIMDSIEFTPAFDTKFSIVVFIEVVSAVVGYSFVKNS